jgi:thioredoxin reductase (NADPH)
LSDHIYPIAIIGGGSAGTMAVLRTVLNNDETLFFPGSGKDKKRSRALWVSKVENMPGHLGYKKGIEEPNRESLVWLSEGPFSKVFHWKKNTGITSIKKRDDEVFELTDSKGEIWLARYVILCTGVMDVQPEIKGSIEPIFDYANVQLADYCLRCDGHHTFGKKTVVIGHGSGAAWVAIMLFERYHNPQMTILTNGEAPGLDAETTALTQKYGITIETARIESIVGDGKAHRLEGFTLENGKTIASEIAFVSLGMIVYNELAKSLGAEVDNRGFVVTDAKGRATVVGLYIAGDLRAGVKKQIYTAWDTAVDSADDINALLRRERRQV